MRLKFRKIRQFSFHFKRLKIISRTILCHHLLLNLFFLLDIKNNPCLFLPILFKLPINHWFKEILIIHLFLLRVKAITHHTLSLIIFILAPFQLIRLPIDKWLQLPEVRLQLAKQVGISSIFLIADTMHFALPSSIAEATSLLKSIQWPYDLFFLLIVFFVMDLHISEIFISSHVEGIVVVPR